MSMCVCVLVIFTLANYQFCLLQSEQPELQNKSPTIKPVGKIAVKHFVRMDLND